MSDKRDYYDILGLDKGAQDDEIKRAYRKLAKKHHPDLNPGDKKAEASFKEVNEAYEVLSDPAKKGRYDQFGHAGIDPSYGGGGGGGGYGGFGGMDFDLGNIFDSFFGGGFSSSAASRNAPQRGESVGVTIPLSFEEAAFGVKKDITVDRTERCESCNGSGAKKGTSADTCQTCHGSGSVKSTTRTPLGVFSSSSVCPDCRGTGKIIKNPCSDCRGVGYVKKRRHITVDIPSGIDNRQTVALRGEGSHGINGGPSGDLHVTVSVRPHPLFERKGYDVTCDLPITMVQATLGAELEIPTLDGKLTYTVPEGTQNAAVFRIKGKGIPHLGGKGRGDHILRIAVEIPRNLNERQKSLLKEFAESVGDTNFTKNKSFFEKVRDAFSK